ncbi:MAG: hypothetical protein PHQ64_03355, partial [Bacilli bacterium]|nr:hypothetical protein [Bacilli bacterium]
LPDGVAGIFVKITLIVALIWFAKDAPKFISKALGLKGTGLGMGMAGALGFAGGLAGGAGFGGALKTAGSQMNAYSTADVDGKASTAGIFGKGKEAASKMAGGKSQHQVNKLKKEAKSLGITNDTVGLAKKDAKEAAIKSNEAASIRDKNLNGIPLTPGDQHTIDKFFQENESAVSDWKNSHGGVEPTDSDRIDIMASTTKKASEDATKRFETMSAYAKDVGIREKTNAEKLGGKAPLGDRVKDVLTTDSKKSYKARKTQESYDNIKNNMK